MILLLALMISCVTNYGCSSIKPNTFIKGVDYDEGTMNNPPVDKTTWMWITHSAAKKRLKWINDNGK